MVLAICQTLGNAFGSFKPTNSAVPTFTSPKPSTWAFTPMPDTTSTLLAASSGNSLAWAAFTTAVASGWLAWTSTLAANCSTSSLRILLLTIIESTICGLPLVKVPVLSNTTVSTLPAISKLWASLNHTPWRAATPIPAIMAAGVASPNAQGQAITNTDTACKMALSIAPVIDRVRPNVTNAISTTTGTNTAATLSAKRAKSALLPWASLSALTISLSWVSLPLAVTW